MAGSRWTGTPNELRARAGLIPQFFLLALLAFAQPLRDRGAPSDQRGFIGQPLGEIGMILRHDIEDGFPAEPAMVLGQEAVHVGKLFVVHCFSRL